MNTTSLFLFPIASLAAITLPQLPTTLGLEDGSALVDAIPACAVVAESSLAPAILKPAHAPTGRGLQTGTIEPASGLDSMARGLTPVNEWRLLFPQAEKSR